MTWTDDIERTAEPVRHAILQHPFITGIGRGDLDVERFKFYVRQDYVYLIDYSRVLALASARAPDLDTQSRFARLLDATLNTEMALHRGYCARFDVSQRDLEATRAAPTTVAYTRFLLDVAYRAGWEEVVASLLPCQWGYWEIGDHLSRQGEPVHAPLYAEWVRMYASPEFYELAAWVRGLADDLARDAAPRVRRAMDEAYLMSLRYEYLFWDMSWRMEGWPV